MDFNRAFNYYDTIEGIRCQTTEKIMSQMDSAVLAVKAIGLNQITEIEEKWFCDNEALKMFNKRLNILKSL